MTYQVVSVGWNCAPFIAQTLASVEAQKCSDWRIWIVDDATEDPAQAQIIRDWCDTRDERWNYTINTERHYAVRNQWDAITSLDPADDDVIVFLDLDGDMLAHDQVLDRLTAVYADGNTLVTYGQYRPCPDVGTSTFASPFPEHVVRSRTYRREIQRGRFHINHLRTMQGRVFRAIPADEFKDSAGEWYGGGTDYLFMVAALELADGRYRCLDEVLLLYNHANPLADNRTRSQVSRQATQDYMSRPALAPM